MTEVEVEKKRSLERRLRYIPLREAVGMKTWGGQRPGIDA